MHRKLIYITGIIALLSTFAFAFVYLYNQFKPSPSNLASVSESVIVNTIPFAEAISYIDNAESDIVLFIRDFQTDSNYIADSLLLSLDQEQNEQQLPEITVVDMSGYEDISVTRLKDVFGIERYPAFVYIHKSESLMTTSDQQQPTTESLTAMSSIVFYSDNPFTSEQLKTWFFNNNLWSGPYSTSQTGN